MPARLPHRRSQFRRSGEEGVPQGDQRLGPHRLERPRRERAAHHPKPVRAARGSRAHPRGDRAEPEPEPGTGPPARAGGQGQAPGDARPSPAGFAILVGLTTPDTSGPAPAPLSETPLQAPETGAGPSSPGPIQKAEPIAKKTSLRDSPGSRSSFLPYSSLRGPMGVSSRRPAPIACRRSKGSAPARRR